MEDSGRKILIVEDERLTAEYMKELVAGFGYAAYPPLDTAEASIEFLKTETPLIVLVDLTLKGELSGLDVAAKCRKMQLPFIFLTAYSDNETLAKIKEAQPYGCILKPINERELDACIYYSIERHDLLIELKESKEKAEHLQAVKSNFLAILSHEIRTPLNSILGAVQMLKDNDSREMKKELFPLMLESGECLNNTITELLALSDIMCDGVELNIRLQNVRELVGDIVDMYESEFMRQGVDLNFKTEEMVPELIHTDLFLIKQALTPLIDNALEFGCGKPVVVNMKCTEEEDDYLWITVIDHGGGISEEQISSVSEPFYQTESANSRNHEGLGLGLTITNELMKQVKGSLVIETSFSGSNCSLKFPLNLK